MAISLNALFNKPTMDQKFQAGQQEDEQSFMKERDAELHQQMMKRLQEQERIRQEGAQADVKFAEDTGVKDLLVSGRASDLASAQKMYAEMRGAENATNLVRSLRSFGAAKGAEGLGQLETQALGAEAMANRDEAAVRDIKARADLKDPAMIQEGQLAREARMANARATSQTSENQRLQALAERPMISDVAQASGEADVAVKQLQTAGAKAEKESLEDPQLQGWKRAAELQGARLDAISKDAIQQKLKTDPNALATMTGLNRFRAPTMFDLMEQTSPLTLGAGLRSVAAPPTKTLKIQDLLNMK